MPLHLQANLSVVDDFHKTIIKVIKGIKLRRSFFGSLLVNRPIIVGELLVELVNLSGVEEEVIVITEKGEDLIPDEEKTTVDGELVELVGCHETFVLDFAHFLLDFLFGLFVQFELHFCRLLFIING